jgi:hypothetical protein
LERVVVVEAALKEDGVVRGGPERKGRYGSVFERLKMKSRTLRPPGDWKRKCTGCRSPEPATE